MFLTLWDILRGEGRLLDGSLLGGGSHLPATGAGDEPATRTVSSWDLTREERQTHKERERERMLLVSLFFLNTFPPLLNSLRNKQLAT